MRHATAFAFVLGLLLSACATTLPKALDKVEVGMVAVDVVADAQAEMWAKYVDARIEYCQAREPMTPEARDACLGPALKSRDVEKFLEALVAGQEAMAEMLKTVRELEDKVRPALEAAKEASK